MNKNLDLTKILEGCPKGTKFYSILHDAVYFRCVDLYNDYPIIFDSFMIAGPICLTRNGTAICGIGECIVFPSKDKRDWSKFERFWDKPKVEKFDPKTLQPFDKIISRNPYNKLWYPNLFGYLGTDEVRCIDGNWCCVIPYNEETKHLVGTTKDCPEYYKWWKK